MHTVTVLATEGMRTPVQCGGFARQPLQVLPPRWRLQSFHISPVWRANDVKQGLQLCLCCAVARPCLCTKHLPACRQARNNAPMQLSALKLKCRVHGSMGYGYQLRAIFVIFRCFMSARTDPFEANELTCLPVQTVEVCSQKHARERRHQRQYLISMVANECINRLAVCTHKVKACSKSIPFRRGSGFALDSKHGGHLQLGGGSCPQASHPLQQLPKDAS